MEKLIVFLIRRKLGLKKNERFRFTNQKSKIDRYYFTDNQIMKEAYGRDGYFHTLPSNVKLNYILSDKCKIKKVDD